MNADRILAILASEPGLTDAELRERSGIDPHQLVNQICRRLAAEGRLRREHRPDGRIGNFPRGDSDRASLGPSAPTSARPCWATAARGNSRELPDASLIIVPCSGAKRPGGTAALNGPSVLDLLDAPTAERLRHARQDVATRAGVDESALRPAWERYNGQLYRSAFGLASAVAGGRRLVVLSGGYGVVLAEEPIGFYDRSFRTGDWPRDLLDESLVQVVRAIGAGAVVSFCSQSIGYAKVIRRVARRRAIDVHAVTPDLAGRSGAMVLAPRAAGEALDAHLGGRLTAGWQSSDGVPVNITTAPAR